MVSLQSLNGQEPVELRQEIVSSGEAKIYQTNKVGVLAKIYHSISPEKVNKLQVMLGSSPSYLSSPGHIAIAWPQDLLRDIDNQCIGFIMPEIQKSQAIINAYNPLKRKEKFPKFTWYELHKTALNLASIIQSLHAQKYVIGDLKPENLLVNEQGLVSIIDTDSFQVIDPQTGKIYLSPVTSAEYTAPEMLGEVVQNVGRSEVQDRFGLAIIIWLLLFGYHPFYGQWTGEGNQPNIDQLIRDGNWMYGPNSQLRPGKLSIPLEILHPRLQHCFYQCFNDGHNNPKNRPIAEDWVKTLDAAIKDLVPCSIDGGHYYGRSYGKCYWCERKQQLDFDIFVSRPPPPPPAKRWIVAIIIPLLVVCGLVCGSVVAIWWKKPSLLTQLENYLDKQEWEKADKETRKVLLKITGRESEGWLDTESINNLSCSDISKIDKLWEKSSSKRFGFRLQKRIWVSVGGKDNDETKEKLGERLGWRKGKNWLKYPGEMTFSSNAKEGHLPVAIWEEFLNTPREIPGIVEFLSLKTDCL